MKLVVVFLMMSCGFFSVYAGGFPVVSKGLLWAEKQLVNAKIKHVAITDLYFPCSIKYQYETFVDDSVWLEEKTYFVPEHKLHCDGRKDYEEKVLEEFIAD